MLSIKRSEQTKWKNWSEIVLSYPEAVLYPKSISDLEAIIHLCQTENKRLRVVGAGHSFTPLVATSELIVSLENLTGIDKIDHETSRVTVWAGTSIKETGELLHQHGYAMENMGDINVQSIAGAISTGTHGTGVEFGSISTQVTKLTIITGTGEIIDISADENREYFNAARVSLGMLGIIVKVELQAVPQHALISNSYRLPLDDCLTKLDELKANNRHFEFFWFPHTEIVQIKTINQTDDLHTQRKSKSFFNDIVVENGVFWLLSEMCRLQPKLSKAVSTISANAVPVGTIIGDDYSLYATERLVKFNEMEYSVPAEKMAVIIRDIKRVLEKKQLQVHFPIECRYVKRDNIWLSPSYKQDSAYIAVHMYKGMDLTKYFHALEEIFIYHGGRPHWGKLHTVTNDKLIEMYPMLEKFLAVREKFDPNKMFLNPYLRHLFSI